MKWIFFISAVHVTCTLQTLFLTNLIKRPLTQVCIPIAIQAMRKLKPTSSHMAKPVTTPLLGERPTSFHTLPSITWTPWFIKRMRMSRKRPRASTLMEVEGWLGRSPLTSHTKEGRSHTNSSNPEKQGTDTIHFQDCLLKIILKN